MTGTVSAVSAGGACVVIDESSLTMYAAGVSPKFTAVAWEKAVPVITTVVPPVTGPLAGLMPDTTGTGMKSNRSLGVGTLVPPAVVTVTSPLPPLATGETAVIEVPLFTTKLAATV
jgi:hypothetical protein